MSFWPIACLSLRLRRNKQKLTRFTKLFVPENGVIGNFDPGIQGRQYKNNFYFSGLDFHLKRLRTAP
jgi:hypothetical protein